MKRLLPVAFLAALLAGCGSQPNNVAMPPADKREKEAKVVIPPLNSGKTP